MNAPSFLNIRLHDVVHHNSKLYLVFEYLDLDLKRYMDSIRTSGGMKMDQIKVVVLHFDE